MTLRHLATAPLLMAEGLMTSRRPPILLAGMPRSGSTWVGAVMATAGSVRYYMEPFNAQWRRLAEPFQFRYVRADESVGRFDAYARAAFDGRIGGPSIERHRSPQYHRYAWWPGRVLIKEVHAILALDRVEALVDPAVVVIVRHPCAVASSWARLDKERPGGGMWGEVDAHLATLLGQPALLDDHLGPYVDVLTSARTYLEKVGALWGALYTVMLRQARANPDWVVVTHEAISRDPAREFAAIFASVGLRKTPTTAQELERTTTAEGKTPFDAVRVSADEPDKWRRELTEAEAAEVLEHARPFGIDLYPDTH